jgi:hypothetical protein
MHSIAGPAGKPTTQSAIEFFNKYGQAFGNVVVAEMKRKIIGTPEWQLTLTNIKGETMVFKGECTSGYPGEGPSGTLLILNQSGFDVDKEFIGKHDSFKLEKNTLHVV